MTIEMYDKFFHPVVGGEKIQTIRKGRRDYELGNATLHFNNGRNIPIKIEEVIYKKVGDLSDHDAIMDGFMSLAELLITLAHIYEDLDVNDTVTLVRWASIKNPIQYV